MYGVVKPLRIECGPMHRRLPRFQRMGIVEFSTGNLCTGFEFFEIVPYSSCKKLGDQVQKSADGHARDTVIAGYMISQG